MATKTFCDRCGKLMYADNTHFSDADYGMKIYVGPIDEYNSDRSDKRFRAIVCSACGELYLSEVLKIFNSI
jgi:formylmethanofuran dehydrogenase subunit E